ncbi:MAG: hypothetical protein R3E51_01020 [Rhizobiaceae bacterium]
MARRPVVPGEVFSTTISTAHHVGELKAHHGNDGNEAGAQDVPVLHDRLRQAFACAVRTKSCSMTSIIPERVMRAMMAALEAERQCGQYKAERPAPSHGKPAEIDRTDHQHQAQPKWGIETPPIAIVMTMASTQLPRRAAAQKPAGNPMATAITMAERGEKQRVGRPRQEG